MSPPSRFVCLGLHLLHGDFFSERHSRCFEIQSKPLAIQTCRLITNILPVFLLAPPFRPCKITKYPDAAATTIILPFITGLRKSCCIYRKPPMCRRRDSGAWASDGSGGIKERAAGCGDEAMALMAVL